MQNNVLIYDIWLQNTLCSATKNLQFKILFQIKLTFLLNYKIYNISFWTPKPILFSYLAFSSICLVIVVFHHKIYSIFKFIFLIFFYCCYRFHFTSKIMLLSIICVFLEWVFFMCVEEDWLFSFIHAQVVYCTGIESRYWEFVQNWRGHQRGIWREIEWVFCLGSWRWQLGVNEVTVGIVAVCYGRTGAESNYGCLDLGRWFCGFAKLYNI